MSVFEKALEQVTAEVKETDPLLACFARAGKNDWPGAPGMSEAVRKLDGGASRRNPEISPKPAGWEHDPALRHYFAMNKSPVLEYLFANRTPKIT